MKVLLISVQPSLDIIGLRILHHFLLEHGHDSQLLFLPRFEVDDRNALDAISRFVAQDPPGLIGVSLMSADFRRAVSVTRRLKREFPDTPVLWGGIHSTVMPDECAEYADYVCVGEGEQSLLDAAAALDAGKPLSGINNMCYRKDGALQRNPLYPLEEDLDKFPVISPMPPQSYVLEPGAVVAVTRGHLRKYMKYRGGVYKIMTSRGCPYACTYCCNHHYQRLYNTRSFRRHSVEHVMAEVELALRDGPTIEYVDFTDDCFLGHDLDYFRHFCSEYKSRIGKPFAGRGTPREITRERMAMAVDAGMVWVNVGLQSGSDRVCREVFHRAIPVDDYVRAAQVLSEFPVSVVYDVIVDNPFETESEALETAELLLNTPRPFQLVMYSLSFYFGTDLRERALKEYPEAVGDAFTKNHYVRGSSTTNHLIEMTPSLPVAWLRWLISRYRTKPRAFATRAALFGARVLCKVLLHPIVYFRLVLRSQHGSVWRALRVMPVLADFGVMYYFNGLKWFRRR